MSRHVLVSFQRLLFYSRGSLYTSSSNDFLTVWTCPRELDYVIYSHAPLCINSPFFEEQLSLCAAAWQANSPVLLMAVYVHAAVRVSCHAQRNPGSLSTLCLLLSWLCQRDGEWTGRLFRTYIHPIYLKNYVFFFLAATGATNKMQYMRWV
jgi:hypothetical protein